MNTYPNVLSTLTLASALLVLLSCDLDPKNSSVVVHESITKTEVATFDFRNGESYGFTFNQSDVLESKPSRFWQVRRDKGELYLELNPTKANESITARGEVISYGIVALEDLDKYQEIVIVADVDLTKIHPDFLAAPSGCDVRIEVDNYFQGRTIEGLSHSCLGQNYRSFGFLKNRIFTMGEDSVKSLWWFTLYEFSKGLVGYANVSLPASNIVVKGYRYDRPVYADSFKYDRFTSEAQHCSVLMNLDGEITLNVDGVTGNGVLTAHAESFVLTAEKNDEAAFEMSAELKSDSRTLNARLYYGQLTSLELHLDAEGCKASILFSRIGVMTAKRISTDVLYASVEHGNYGSPFLVPEKTGYQQPELISGIGFNLTPKVIQLAEDDSIAMLVSPVFVRDNNDALSMDMTVHVTGEDGLDFFELKYFVNYGNGWLYLPWKRQAPVVGKNIIERTFLYSPLSNTIQVAVSISPRHVKATDRKAGFIVEEIKVSNLKENRDSSQLGHRVDISFNEYFNLESCMQGLPNSIVLDYDNESRTLTRLYSDSSDTAWQITDELYFSKTVTINDVEYHFLGNLSAEQGVVSAKSCADDFIIRLSL